jgi:hypothetical protein
MTWWSAPTRIAIRSAAIEPSIKLKLRSASQIVLKIAAPWHHAKQAIELIGAVNRTLVVSLGIFQPSYSSYAALLAVCAKAESTGSFDCLMTSAR